ncbi:MAG: DNA cytosine methyltransferase [Holophagaceae bacterium]|nr:DNA cytosine methyltransferase [Holophagaceae bacterium]
MENKAIEFFSGIGGWRYAFAGLGSVISAVDISEVANSVYAMNFGVIPKVRELATIRADEIKEIGSDSWLLSPPCQPYCRMGNSRDLADPRSAALVNLMKILKQFPPKRFVMENVEGFLESNAFNLVGEHLEIAGLKWRTFCLCPSQFGFPNRRRRVFVIASDEGIRNSLPPSSEPVAISSFLDEAEDKGLYLSVNILAKHKAGMDIVTKKSNRTACFIGGYGSRFVGSGSFLETSKGIRRFSPSEISRLLGFPASFRFPFHVSLANRYKLLGNSLNPVVAKWALGQLN